MRLFKFVKGMIFITVLALIYINMQMQIFDLAYQGKNKERYIRQLHENNGNVTYNILKLKSANNIGYKLLTEKSDMQFVDNADVVKLQTAQLLIGEKDLILASDKKTNPLLSFLSFGSRAEARDQE